MVLFNKCGYTKCNRINFYIYCYTLRFVVADIWGLSFSCDINKILELVNLSPEFQLGLNKTLKLKFILEIL